MREIWQASDPTLPPLDPRPYTDTPVSPLVSAWWGMLLARGVISWMVFLSRGVGARTVDSILKAAQILRAEYAVSVIAAGLADMLVFLVSRRQDDLAEQLFVLEQAKAF